MTNQAIIWFKFGVRVENSDDRDAMIREAMDELLSDPIAYIDADAVDEIEEE